METLPSIKATPNWDWADARINNSKYWLHDWEDDGFDELTGTYFYFGEDGFTVVVLSDGRIAEWDTENNCPKL